MFFETEIEQLFYCLNERTRLYIQSHSHNYVNSNNLITFNNCKRIIIIENNDEDNHIYTRFMISYTKIKYLK